MVRLGEVGSHLWDELRAELEAKLKQSVDFDHRRLAHDRRLRRELSAKYGPLRELLLDPRFQAAKHFLEENLDADPLLGEPLLPWSTAVILLVVLSKHLSGSMLLLAAALLFHANPLYVLLVVIAVLVRSSKRLPRQFAPRTITRTHTHKRAKDSERECESVSVCERDSESASLSFEEASLQDEYEHVLLGADLATLYAAALLSRCGHHCLVVQPAQSEPVEVCPEGAPFAVPLSSCIVSRPEKYQALLDVAQSADKEERVLFAPVGREKEGFTSTIVSWRKNAHSAKGVRSFWLRAGENSLLGDLSSWLILDKSLLNALFLKVRAAVDSLAALLSSRVHKSVAAVPAADEVVQQSLQSLLAKNNVSDERVEDVLSALSIAVGQEAQLSSRASAVSLALALSLSESGAFVPEGGAARVTRALCRTVRESGGIVLRDAKLRNVDFSVADGVYSATGVTLEVDAERSTVSVIARSSVISGLGVLCSSLSLLPREALSAETKQRLLAVRERRPQVKVVLWLRGSAEELQLHSAQHIEIGSSRFSPSADATLSTDVLNKELRRFEERLHASFVHVWSPSTQGQIRDPSTESVQAVVVAFEADESMVELETLQSLHAEGEDSSFVGGPRLYASPRDPLSSPNHEGFGSSLGRSLSLSQHEKDLLKYRAELVVRKLYPHTAERVILAHVVEPVLGGRNIANDVNKYITKFSATTDIKGFFLTGNDIALPGLMGELQSGWATVSAVLGYTPEELQQGRNVLTDLQSILE